MIRVDRAVLRSAVISRKRGFNAINVRSSYSFDKLSISKYFEFNFSVLQIRYSFLSNSVFFLFATPDTFCVRDYNYLTAIIHGKFPSRRIEYPAAKKKSPMRNRMFPLVYTIRRRFGREVFFIPGKRRRYSQPTMVSA